jgi:hypothetical protein
MGKKFSSPKFYIFQTGTNSVTTLCKTNTTHAGVKSFKMHNWKSTSVWYEYLIFSNTEFSKLWFFSKYVSNLFLFIFKNSYHQ